jgi:hypothetical protein
VGNHLEAVEGHLWLKVRSKEVSGHFPAEVKIKAPADLYLEITNMLGGTEATILVQDQHYEIRRGKKKEYEGLSTWAGLPLRWATDLFIGKVPCPKASTKAFSEWNLRTNDTGDLIVESKNRDQPLTEKYSYQFREEHGQPWMDHLVWESFASGQKIESIEFSFEDPEDATQSPKKWEAKSAQGVLRVRWGSRRISLQPN